MMQVALLLCACAVPATVHGADWAQPYTERIELNTTFSEIIESVLNENKYIPEECTDIRYDLCWALNTYHDSFGDIHWPNTHAGDRVYVQCPYADPTESPVYASRVCSYNGTHAYWQPEMVDSCPGRPLTEAVRIAHATIGPGTPLSMEEKAELVPDIVAMFNHTLVVFDWVHPSNDELMNSSIIIADVINICVNTSTTGDAEMIKQLLYITDYLMTNGHNSNMLNLISLVQIPTILHYEPDGGNWELHQTSFQFTLMTSQNNMTVHVENSDNDTLNIDISSPDNPVPITWHTVIVIDSTFLIRPDITNVVSAPEITTQPAGAGISGSGERSKRSILHETDANKGNRPLVKRSSDVFTNESIASTNVTLVSEEATTPLYIQVETEIPPWPPASSLRPSFYGGSFSYYTPLLRDVDALSNVQVVYSVAVDYPGTLCVTSTLRPEQNPLLWTTEGCTLLEETDTTARCSCSATINALYGAFVQEIRSFSGVMYGSPGFWPPYVEGSVDLAAYLMFPYNRAIEITRQVLQAISLVCLVLTVLSYAIFRKARRGLLTTILLHLCVSIICLIVVLYVTGAIASSRIGCRIANVTRTYFILVSLMWNAVEAHNMYRMLIRVFRNTGGKFIYKAAAVAWILPVVPVSIALAVDLMAYDGRYIDCIFKCSPEPLTLYLTLYLPMCVIVAHNLVVFVLVVRVILAKNTVGETKGRRRSRWVQLYGCVTMLVLLGTPWVFAMFGAIEADTSEDLKMLEGIMQIIFIVTLNLQGIFIFIFHCVRIPEMRTQWRSSISKISTGSTVSGSESKPPSSPIKKSHSIVTSDTASSRI